MRILARTLSVLALAALLSAQDPAAEEPLEGFRTVLVRGWTVQVEDALDLDGALRDEVLGLLGAKLREIDARLPAPVVARLREVPIWMRLDDQRSPGGVYHPSEEWLRFHGRDARMARSVEFGVARNFLEWMHTQPSMVLHELAHAWHHQVLGYDHEGLMEAFANAKESGRYADALHVNGSRQRHYGIRNPQEFFAEMTETTWGTNDFFPFVRGELLESDPATAAAVAAAWSTAVLDR
ncbi:MAG TPA: metallopeptidase [Planctomycetota bacterium]